MPADALRTHARMLLARADVDGFAALFAQADGRDPQRRMEAELALIDVGLTATARAQAGVATRIFVALADAALKALEREPSEPLMLNLAGVACYELWSLDGASALFKAALRLDPGLGELRRNLDELAIRRRAAGRRARPLHAAVPGLTRRARAVARRARPTTGLTLSLCMIVRDEEQMLGRCLEAAAPAVDEIVVVDTGSTDRTIEIARSFGARVIEHPWTGSFSEARNVSFEAATGDWLIYLDADEVLAAADVPRLRALLGQTWREAFYLVETSYVGEDGDGGALLNNALRVFRNRPQYRFRDRMHEQILHTLPTFVPGRVEQSTVRVQHYGYLGSVREAKAKSQRNVELLRRQAAESAPTPFLHFNLGSEYAAAGDHDSAVTELRAARSLLERDGSLRSCDYGAALMVRLVTVLRLSGRLDEARRMAADGLALFEDLTDLVLAQARIAQADGELEAAVQLLHRCIEMGDASARYGALVGGGTFLPRLALAELELGRGDAGAARAHLAWCVEHHPDFLAVAGPYAGALLRDGVDPESALAELEKLDRLPGVVRIAIADALAAGGARTAAIEQYRLGLAAGGDRGRARTALGELLLAGGDWDGAAREVRPVAEDDPYAGLASRIELCAVIGRGGPEITGAALGRARAAGLPAAELEVLEAWAAIAAGSAAPDALPVSAAPLLGVLLQTLLRAGDGERFTALLPALLRSRLPERERRELLAGMYLDSGLLGPAAQEWMAVCSARPDARALVGLARVAERHGDGDDAATFARGALELDPGSPAALELLARVAPAGADAVAA